MIDVAAQTVNEPSGDSFRFSKYAWQEIHISARQSPEVNERIERALIEDAANRQVTNKGLPGARAIEHRLFWCESLAASHNTVSFDSYILRGKEILSCTRVVENIRFIMPQWPDLPESQQRREGWTGRSLNHEM
jgi:hypothetical protein